MKVRHRTIQLELARMQELTAKGTLESMIRPKEDYNIFGGQVGFVFCFRCILRTQ